MPMPRQSRHPIVLLTRPAAQSQRFAQELHAAIPGAEIAIAPLMQTVYLAVDLPDTRSAALILTSETGVESARRLAAAGQILPRLAFCVGDHTANAARMAGFDALSAKGNAQDLVAMIAAHPCAGPFLFLRGTDSRGEIAETLTALGKPTFERATYDQKEAPLDTDALALLAGDHRLIVPVFSPRSARLLVKARPINAQSLIWVAAISPAAAADAAGLQPQQMVIATRPDAKAVLHAVAELYSVVIGA